MWEIAKHSTFSVCYITVSVYDRLKKGGAMYIYVRISDMKPRWAKNFTYIILQET